ncbi:tyrosine-type recombinase/integrase [Nonomuraea jabiensis]|uniref:tyrosine-type recombinase/integrase n=1 Tax=Nonomuraea jabiensis TaxID=882448 RepID=UPI003427C88B
MEALPRREATIKDHVILNDDPVAREDLIGLARVSTDAQELARQIDALKTAGRTRIEVGHDEDFTSHVLRYTLGTKLAREGVDATTNAELLGHS